MSGKKSGHFEMDDKLQPWHVNSLENPWVTYNFPLHSSVTGMTGELGL